MEDVRSMIVTTATAKIAARRAAMRWDSTFFDRIVTAPDWLQLAETVAQPAFDEFAALNTASWWCRVVYVADMRLPTHIASLIGTCFPAGGAIRFSSIFEMVRIPAFNDPFCALFYNKATQRAYWVSQLWDGQPRVDPVDRAEIATEELLRRANVFAKELLSWENKHPPTSIGFEPYLRYGLAA